MNHTLLSAALPAVPHRRRWLRQPVGRGHWRRWRRLLVLLYALLAIAGLHHYLPLVSATTAVGILALLYSPVAGKHPPGGFRFGWLALFFIGLYFLLPVKTILYLAMGCAACQLRETFFHRVERTTPFILLLMTPVTAYFVETFSFPIRLQLTTMAGRLISLAGLPVAVTGNSLTWRDHAFTVDPACIGLHMLLVSLLTGLLLMNYYQSQYRRQLSTGAILLLLLLVTTFNILANLLRIICLVVLAILPGNPLHGILGMVFLLAYILLPLIPITRYTIRRWSIPIPDENAGVQPLRSRGLLTGNLLLAAGATLLVLLSFFAEKARPAGLTPGDDVPGYKIKEVEGSVLQLDNGSSLVYIKPIPGFYYTDHTPTICWQGSGYTFTTLHEAVISGIRVFEGVLEKDHQRLYTAWWYDNGIHQTITAEWRWDLIRGAPPYSVVNITAATRAELEAEVAKAVQIHPFRHLLGRSGKPAKVKIW